VSGAVGSAPLEHLANAADCGAIGSLAVTFRACCSRPACSRLTLEGEMRARITLVVAVLAAGMLASPAGVLAGTTKVKVGNDFFRPGVLKIKPKTKVKFKWAGGVKHNVTYKSGPGRAFASKTTKKKGVNFKRTFKKKGKYKLYCTLHPSSMKMKVKVR
jgi:plastocyanin